MLPAKQHIVVLPDTEVFVDAGIMCVVEPLARNLVEENDGCWDQFLDLGAK